ncbi:ArnT family glycosyltransferase [Pareuzebyella sediminis]|uniref:ArnT family glycosyltransferase n=1 Tax=Pareuzebyella sediminis TaxID=2607998 RepID=UPI001E3C35AB|nr:glycosyltransferase family 39 protein [Pareuzebyella sediminis]
MNVVKTNSNKTFPADSFSSTIMPGLPRKFLVLLGLVFLVNVVQSYCTPLIFDEAYYWYYAQNLAWGYFDHPPMVALMVKLGTLLFNGELGVRLVSCILSVGALLFIWLTIDNPQKKKYIVHFFVLVFSMALFNAYGFFTLPDTPLLFFTALFLWVYKHFLQHSTALWAVLLGLVMAALMYSKYHAVLVILFVLISNLRLVTNKYAWLSVIVALLCYTPHFIWLYQNDFVTVNYHLFERPNDPYNFTKYTLGFFVNLVAIFGFTCPWIYWSLLKTRKPDQFTKALTYLTYGIIIFFFISSFNRRIQTQWIIAISIPLAIITFRFMMQDETVRKWIFRMGLINIFIILYLRIGLVYEPISPIFYETHGNKEWVKDLHLKIGDTPVVFENSYRNAPMYEFYTGVPTFSLNNDHYRRNQYSIDGSEERVRHKKILYISKSAADADLILPKSDSTMYYGKYIDDFEPYRKLKTIIASPESVKIGKENTFKVYNPYEYSIPLDKLRFNVSFMTENKSKKERWRINPKPVNPNTSKLPPNDTVAFTFKLPKPQMHDPNFIRIGISENGLRYGINGKTTSIK